MKLTENQLSLLQIAFSIAKARFEDNANSVCNREIAEQFRLQARQLDEIYALLDVEA